MTLMQSLVRDTAVGVGVVTAPEHLCILNDPGCAAAIWQRQPVPDFQSWIDGLDPENLPSGRLILKPDNVRTALSELCDVSRMPTGAHQQCLIDDIAALAFLFSELMGAPYLRLRLDRVTSNACHRFHIDAITARLVCTYRGTGTQYGVSNSGAEPERVFTVPTGNPILLRGTLWPEKPRSGLRHRSPPIEGTGETRLVLVLDPIFYPDKVA